MLRKALWRISSWKVFARNACSAKDLKVLRSGVQSAKVSSRNRSKIIQLRKAFVAARNAHQMRQTVFGFAKDLDAKRKLQEADGDQKLVGAKRTKKEMNKNEMAKNLIIFARIATIRLAAIRNAQRAPLVETLHAKRDPAMPSLSP